MKYIEKEIGLNQRKIIGTSLEVKPTALDEGSTFFEEDTGMEYRYNGTAWKFNKQYINRQPAMRKTVELTRPSDTGAYTAGDIVSATGTNPNLPEVLVGADYAGRYIQITGASVMSDSAVADAKLKNMKVLFYDVKDQATLGFTTTDSAAFAPTYAQQVAHVNGQPLNIDNNADVGANLPVRVTNEVVRKIKLDSSGKFYFAPVILEDLAANSGQKFTFAFYFYIL